MERLFSPCTRFHDIFAIYDDFQGLANEDDEPLQELNLDVSTEELLSAARAFTYADLYGVLGGRETVAWLTPRAAIVPANGKVVSFYGHMNAYRVDFNADGQVIVVVGNSPEHLLETCDVIARLLAASAVQSVILNGDAFINAPLINAPTLAHLMEQCQSLKVLSLMNFEMDENHCRVLGGTSRLGLEIELHSCTAGTSALVEVLGRNQGPTMLDDCEIDYSVLANGLRGNSRLKSLKLHNSGNPVVGVREVLAIAGALRENKGLVDLNLSSCYISDKTWHAICDSLKAHPTLEVMDLRVSFTITDTAPAVLKSRIQALLDMMKMNMSIHTIHLSLLYSQHELFRGSVIPYLEMNRLRPHVRAIQKTRPIAYRAKVLGRALLSARTDPNRFWIILSGNAEVTFPSTTATATTAPAASLPTSATAPVTVSDTTTLTTSATGSSAVDIVVAPASGQKRKAR
jgi:hypothetical protein